MDSQNLWVLKNEGIQICGYSKLLLLKYCRFCKGCYSNLNCVCIQKKFSVLKMSWYIDWWVRTKTFVVIKNSGNAKIVGSNFWGIQIIVGIRTHVDNKNQFVFT